MELTSDQYSYAINLIFITIGTILMLILIPIQVKVNFNEKKVYYKSIKELILNKKNLYDAIIISGGILMTIGIVYYLLILIPNILGAKIPQSFEIKLWLLLYYPIASETIFILVSINYFKKNKS